MTDHYFVAASGDDGATVALIDALLAKESTKNELESFRLDAAALVGENISSSMFMMTDEGPVATFYFSESYTANDRASVEEWLRKRPLVRRITFEQV